MLVWWLFIGHLNLHVNEVFPLLYSYMAQLLRTKEQNSSLTSLCSFCLHSATYWPWVFLWMSIDIMLSESFLHPLFLKVDHMLSIFLLKAVSFSHILPIFIKNIAAQIKRNATSKNMIVLVDWIEFHAL